MVCETSWHYRSSKRRDKFDLITHVQEQRVCEAARGPSGSASSQKSKKSGVAACSGFPDQGAGTQELITASVQIKSSDYPLAYKKACRAPLPIKFAWMRHFSGKRIGGKISANSGPNTKMNAVKNWHRDWHRTPAHQKA
jgi:hypothetical protein